MRAAKNSPLTWAVHLSVLLLVTLWTLPTAGLLISSLRDKDQIVASGWWTGLSTSTQNAMYRAPGADKQVEENGTYVISGNVFEGGKGVATYIGTLLGVAPLMVLVFAVVWLSVAFITRYSSLSALVATLVIPVVLWILGVEEAALVTAAMTVITFWRHKANIERLIAGTEGKIGQKG